MLAGQIVLLALELKAVAEDVQIIHRGLICAKEN
jgi:hypothetical protein